MAAKWWVYPKRRFSVFGTAGEVRSHARTDGLHSILLIDGVEVAADHSPLGGEDAVRNHQLSARLPDGRVIDVELGYIGLWKTGIIVRAGGTIVHESHPGRALAYPEKYRQAAIDMGNQSVGQAMREGWHEGLQGTSSSQQHLGAFAPHNRLPFAVDVATGLLFFAVAKLTDLTTAALVGVAVGIALVLFQRITRIDVTGGLALFGIAVLALSATFALVFQDEEIIKLRGTIIGSLTATLFLTDGLFGGRLLAARLMRFLPYDDIDPGRLGIGIGLLGLVMAGLNFGVARLASTDQWLFYTTFLDTAVAVVLFLMVMRYVRRPAAHRSAERKDV